MEPLDFSKMSLKEILQTFKDKGIFEVDLPQMVDTDVLREKIENLSNHSKLDSVVVQDKYGNDYTENNWLYSYNRQQQIYDIIGQDYINKQGRFIKRFEKAYNEIRGVKLSQTAKTLIGDLVREIASKKVFKIDFVDEIDWNDGEFGKDDSCWWGCYSESKDIFINGGGWGIRFYNEEDEGIGRVWCFPFEDQRTFVLFNAYLDFSGGPLDQFARMLANICGGLKYKKVNLINGSEGNDYPYINNHRGYAVSFDGTFDDEYDMDLDGGEHYEYHCENCGEGINEDYVCWGDDNAYCEDCYNRFYSTCDHCGNGHHIDEMTYIDSANGSYCERCVERYFSSCETCSELYSNDDLTFDGETRCYYCESCYNDLIEERGEDDDEPNHVKRTDNKLKVGDFIIYNPDLPDGYYSITDKRMITGVIIRMMNHDTGWDFDDIRIKILDHVDSFRIGEEYDVRSKYFIKIPTDVTEPVINPPTMIDIIELLSPTTVEGTIDLIINAVDEFPA